MCGLLSIESSVAFLAIIILIYATSFISWKVDSVVVDYAITKENFYNVQRIFRNHNLLHITCCKLKRSRYYMRTYLRLRSPGLGICEL